MASDLISEVIDSPVVHKQFMDLVDDCNTSITALNTVALSAQKITFDFKGLEGLSALTDLLKRAGLSLDAFADAQNNVTVSVNKLNAATVQFSATAAENAKALAEQRLELGYVDSQLKAVMKDIQDGKGNIDANNASLAMWTKRQQELKVEIGATTSALKSEIKETAAAAGSIDEMSQKLFQLKEQYRALSAEQRNSQFGKAMNVSIAQLDSQVEELDKSIGNSQRNVDNYGNVFTGVASRIQQFIVRDLFRATAYFIVFEALFGSIQKIGEAILGNIPGTDLYIQKQEKLKQANDALAGSFDNLTDSIIKEQELERGVGLTLLNNASDRQAIADNTVAGAKRAEAAIKAQGIVAGAVYDAEMSQLKAANEVRDQELSKLNERLDIIRTIQSVITRSQGENDDVVQENFDKAEIPEKQKKELSLSISKAISDGANMNNVLDNLRAKFIGESDETKENIKQKEEEKQNAITEVDAKHTELKRQKAIELNASIAAANEQLRQANEQESAESVDKIVADTKAAYALAAEEINKNKEKYRLSVTTKKDTGYVDDQIRAYDKLLAVTKQTSEENRKNREYELSGSQYSNYLNTVGALSSGAADLAASNGVPDYDKMVAALDKQIQAKKDALYASFVQQASQIEDSNQVIEAQNQYDEKLKQIDSAAYKERLAIAGDYFNQLAALTAEASKAFTTDQDTNSVNAINKILGGKGNSESKSAQIEVEKQKDAILKAQEEIRAAQSQIPAAQEALGRSNDAATNADTPERMQAASEQALKDYQALATLQNQVAVGENKVLTAEQAIHEARKQQLEDLKSTAIRLADETASAIITIQDNQYAQESMNLDYKEKALELSSQQEKDAINASTNYQIAKSNQLSALDAQTQAQQNALQQEQKDLAIKKAKFDKEASEAQVILKTAEAIAATLPLYANPATVPFAIAQDALITAIGAAQYAAAASTPIPQYKFGTPTSTHPGGPFMAGDGYEREYIKAPGKPGYWSKDIPSLYNEPEGTTVTPYSKIIRFAQSNITSSLEYSRAGAAKILLQSVSNSTSDATNDKLEEVGKNIVYAVMRSKTTIKADRSIAVELRKHRNIQ